MLQQYLVQTKETDDQLLATRLAPYLPQSVATPARPPQQNKTQQKPFPPRRPKPQGGGKRSQQPKNPRGGRQQATRSTNKKVTKLYTRKQQPRAVGHEQDSQLGRKISMTKLKYIAGHCNNFQIWNECALYKQDPTSCTYKHSCSSCFSPLHGRRSCHQLTAPEDPNA